MIILCRANKSNASSDTSTASTRKRNFWNYGNWNLGFKYLWFEHFFNYSLLQIHPSKLHCWMICWPYNVWRQQRALHRTYLKPWMEPFPFKKQCSQYVWWKEIAKEIAKIFSWLQSTQRYSRGVSEPCQTPGAWAHHMKNLRKKMAITHLILGQNCLLTTHYEAWVLLFCLLVKLAIKYFS